MSPRSLEQIIAELNPTYQPQVESIQQRIAALPGQIQAEEQGLGAKQEEAFGNILSGARRRGTGIAFGGIPLAEQARYTATEYLPALARLRQAGKEQEMSLQDAINQIYERRNTQAQNIYQTEQQREFERQQAEANRQAQLRAAVASAIRPTLGALGGAQTSGNSGARIDRDKSGGFQFSYNGRPISAYEYSQLTGVGYRQLLQNMAKDGDKNAQIALKYVNDYGQFSNVDRAYAGALSALGARGTYSQAVKGGALGLGGNAF